MQEEGSIPCRDVDGSEVDASPLPNLERSAKEIGRDAPSLSGAECEPCPRISEGSLGIAVPVAVEDEVEARARPELDQVER